MIFILYITNALLVRASPTEIILVGETHAVPECKMAKELLCDLAIKEKIHYFLESVIQSHFVSKEDARKDTPSYEAIANTPIIRLESFKTHLMMSIFRIQTYYGLLQKGWSPEWPARVLDIETWFATFWFCIR